VTNIDRLFILLQEARWAFKWSGFFIPLEIKIYAVGADGNIVTGGAKYNCPSILATTTPLNRDPVSRVNGRKISLMAPRGKLGPLIV